MSAGGEIGKEGQRLEVLKSGKGVKFLLLRVDDPQLRFISPRVTVAQLAFVTSWVLIFLIPVLCSHFSWFALVLTPSFSPPHPHIPLPSHLSLPLWNVLSVCVAACARPPHMVPFHSCVDCAPPLQISEVSESPPPPQTFIYLPWPGSVLHPDFHFWSMRSSAERASKLTPGAGGGGLESHFLGWLSLRGRLVSASAGNASWRAEVLLLEGVTLLQLDVLVCSCLLAEPACPDQLCTESLAPLCWESLGFGGHQHQCIPSRNWGGDKSSPSAELSFPPAEMVWDL